MADYNLGLTKNAVDLYMLKSFNTLTCEEKNVDQGGRKDAWLETVNVVDVYPVC